MRFSLLLLTPLLLLSGCSKANYYAEKLQLPTLETPQVLAPVTNDDTNSLALVTSPIEKASSPSEADASVAQVNGLKMLSQSALMDDSDPKDPPAMVEKKKARDQQRENIFEFLGQAAKIKGAQLQDGDSSDSTGEVAQRINYALQSRANAGKLDEGIPEHKSNFANMFADPTAAPTATLAPSQVLGVPTATPLPTPTERPFQ